jgi:hypothetical protein
MFHAERATIMSKQHPQFKMLWLILQCIFSSFFEVFSSPKSLIDMSKLNTRFAALCTQFFRSKQLAIGLHQTWLFSFFQLNIHSKTFPASNRSPLPSIN